MKRICSLVLALVLCLGLCVPALAADFSDVPESSPFAAAIRWAVEKNITNGTTPTTFSPSNTCTTSHILTFLWRAAGRPGDAGEERAAVTAWAAGLGIDLFDLSAPCTRAAAVTYIWKSQGSPAAGPASFSDVPAGADYAAAVAWAVENGVTNGTGNGVFSPDSVCTRGQIVTFLFRALESDSQTPAQPETPVQPVAKPTTIAVSSAPYLYRNVTHTGWTIADNGWGDGKLNNGKDITEANVMDLMKEAYTIWRDDMSWSNGSTATNVYNYSDIKSTNATTVINGLKGQINGVTGQVNTVDACGGFACMISDYIFGANENPLRKLDDSTQVRPGDIMVIKNTAGYVTHIEIALGTVTYVGSIPCIPGEYSGNIGGTVQWSDNCPVRLDLGQVDVYTRYPA